MKKYYATLFKTNVLKLSSYIKPLFVALFLFCFVSNTDAQDCDWVNSSFENLSGCPTTHSQFGTYTESWHNMLNNNTSTPDIYSNTTSCSFMGFQAQGITVSTDVNFHGCNASGLFLNYNDGSPQDDRYREYIGQRVDLVSGRTYTVTMDLAKSTSNTSNTYTEDLAIYLYTGPIPASQLNFCIVDAGATNAPQVATIPHTSVTTNLTTVTVSFTPTANYQYMYLGGSDCGTFAPNTGDIGYMYIDNVRLTDNADVTLNPTFEHVITATDNNCCYNGIKQDFDLYGNAAPTGATILWGQSASNPETVTFATPTAVSSTISGSGNFIPGTYEFYYSFSKGGCSATDTFQLEIGTPTALMVSAGPDQTDCNAAVTGSNSNQLGDDLSTSFAATPNINTVNSDNITTWWSFLTDTGEIVITNGCVAGGQQTYSDVTVGYSFVQNSQYQTECAGPPLLDQIDGNNTNGPNTYARFAMPIDTQTFVWHAQDEYCYGPIQQDTMTIIHRHISGSVSTNTVCPGDTVLLYLNSSDNSNLLPDWPGVTSSFNQWVNNPTTWTEINPGAEDSLYIIAPSTGGNYYFYPNQTDGSCSWDGYRLDMTINVVAPSSLAVSAGPDQTDCNATVTGSNSNQMGDDLSTSFAATPNINTVNSDNITTWWSFLTDTGEIVITNGCVAGGQQTYSDVTVGYSFVQNSQYQTECAGPPLLDQIDGNNTNGPNTYARFAMPIDTQTFVWHAQASSVCGGAGGAADVDTMTIIHRHISASVDKSTVCPGDTVLLYLNSSDNSNLLPDWPGVTTSFNQWVNNPTTWTEINPGAEDSLYLIAPSTGGTFYFYPNQTDGSCSWDGYRLDMSIVVREQFAVSAGPDQILCNTNTTGLQTFNMNATPNINNVNASDLATWWSLIVDDTTEVVFGNGCFGGGGSNQLPGISMGYTFVQNSQYQTECAGPPLLDQIDGNNSNAPNSYARLSSYGCYDLVWHVVDFCVGDTLVDTVQICWSYDEPLADAGVDQTPSCNTTQLQGNVSAASAANFGCYRWKQLTGPEPVQILDSLNNVALLSGMDTLAAGDYTFEYRLGCHPCFIYDTIKVTIVQPLDPPGITFTSDWNSMPICFGDSVEVTASGGTQYAFFINGATEQDFSPVNSFTFNEFVPGINRIDVIGILGSPSCFSYADTVIYIDVLGGPVAINPGPDGTFCPGGGFDLSATNPVGDNIIWYTTQVPSGTPINGALGTASGATFTVFPTANTTYYGFAIDNTTGCSATEYVTQTATLASLPPVPYASNFTPSNACPGSTIQLRAYINPSTNNRVLWYDNAAGTGTPLNGANGTASGAYFNGVTPAVATTYYAFTLNTTGGCQSATGRPQLVTLRGINTPNITTASPQNICSGENVDLVATISNNPGTMRVRWFTNNTATPPYVQRNSGATYTVSPSTTTVYYAFGYNQSYNCSPVNGMPYDSIIVNVSSVPSGPSGASASPSAVCDGGSTTLTANGCTTLGDTLVWYLSSVPSGSPIATGNNAVVTPSGSSTTYYAFCLNIAGGCLSSASSAVSVINTATPTITGTTPNDRCGTGTVTLGATASAGTINWYAASTGGSSLGTGTSYTTPSISTNTTYYVDATNNGCTTGSRTAVLATINADPTVSITGASSICIGATTALSPTSGGTWVSNTPAVASVTNAGVVTGLTAGTSTFTFTNTATGCSATTSAVTVNADPTVSITGTSSICIGATTALSPTSGGTWVSNTPAVASVTNAGVVTGLTAGTATFTFTNTATSCSATTSAITVNADPTVSITGSSSICIGTTTALSPTSGGTWVSNTPAVASVTNGGLVTGLTAGTSTFTFTNTATGCSATTSAVTVNADPTVSITGTSSICIGATTALSPTSGGTWVSNTPAVASVTNAGLVTGLTAGTSTFTFTNTATGCSATTSAVTVTASPTMTVTSGPTCNGPLTTYSITITNGSGVNITSSSATNGTTTESGTTVTVSGIPSGSGTVVSFTDANGCSGTFNQAVFTCSSCAVAVTITPATAEFCAGDNLVLTATPSGGTGVYTYLWSGNASGTASTATVTTGGTATVAVTDQNGAGCTTTVSKIVTMNALPTVSITGSSSICSGLTTTLSPTSGGTWVSNTPAVASVTNGGLVTGLTAGTSTFTFTNTATGCSATTSAVTVTASPTMTVTSGPTCNGPLTTYSITLTNGSGVNITSSSATNGTTSESGTTVTVSGIPSGSGTVVSFTDANGCSGTFNQAVFTCSPCAVAVTITPGTAEFCAGDNLVLTATPSGGTGVYTYLWSGNASGTASTATVTTGGTATVAVTDQNGAGCTTTVNKIVTMNALPTVSITGSSSICIGGTSALSPTTGGTWVSNTPAVASVTNAGLVTGLTAGTSTFTFTNTATGCSATTSAVTVNADPTVSITGTSSICIGATTALSPTSGGTWVSNTPAVASVTNAGLVTGLTAGTSTFTFTNTATGCSATTSAVTVTASPTMTVTSGPTCNGPLTTYSITITNGSGVNITSSSATNGTTTESGTTVTVSGIPSGSGTVVSFTDANGCSGTFNQAVFTCSSCAVAVTITPATAEFCAGDNLVLTATPSGGTGVYTYLWSGNASGTASTATVTTGGTATVAVTDQNGAGCTTTVSKIVTMNALPTVSITGSSSICSGLTTTLSPTSGGTWVSNTPAVASVTNGGLVTGLTAGTSTFTFTNTATGCSATTSAVTVTASPTMTVTSGPTCNGPLTTYSITLTNGSGVNITSSSATNGTTSESGTTVTVSGIPSGSGTVVSFTDANGCSGTFNQAVFTCSPCAVAVTITPGTAEFCAGDNLVLTATPSGGTGVYTYLWSGNASGTASTATVTTGGTATVAVTDQNGAGCTTTVNKIVTMNALPTQPTVTSPITNTCPVSTVDLTSAPTSAATGVFVYKDNAGNVITTPTSVGAGNYTVQDSIAGTGCISSAAPIVVNITSCGSPDLNPTINITPNNGIAGSTNMRMIVTIKEIDSIATDDIITITIPKVAQFATGITYNQNATSVGGITVENSEWVMTTTASAWIFTRTSVMTPLEISRFGIVNTFDAGSSQGNVTFTVNILNGSGGENNTLNNADYEVVYYVIP